jgi:hypothetical protein
VHRQRVPQRSADTGFRERDHSVGKSLATELVLLLSGSPPPASPSARDKLDLLPHLPSVGRPVEVTGAGMPAVLHRGKTRRDKSGEVREAAHAAPPPAPAPIRGVIGPGPAGVEVGDHHPVMGTEHRHRRVTPKAAGQQRDRPGAATVGGQVNALPLQEPSTHGRMAGGSRPSSTTRAAGLCCGADCPVGPEPQSSGTRGRGCTGESPSNKEANRLTAATQEYGTRASDPGGFAQRRKPVLALGQVVGGRRTGVPRRSCCPADQTRGRHPVRR